MNIEEKLKLSENTIEAKAEKWMSDNPNAYKMFERFALQMCNAGRRWGAKMVGERMRWETRLNTVDDDGFKVNNNYIAYLAREFMRNYPQYKNLIETRKTK